MMVLSLDLEIAMIRATILSLLLPACVPSALTTAPVVDTDLRFEQQHNYAWTGTLTLSETQLEAESHFTIDWSGFTPDPRTLADGGYPELVYIAKLKFPGADLPQLLLTERATSGATFQYYPFDATTQSIDSSQLIAAAFPFEPGVAFFEDPAEGWVVIVAGAEGPMDLMSMRLLTPLEASTNTSVALVDGQSTLTTTVDLHSMPPIEATAGSASYQLDWSGLTHDTHGNPIEPKRLNELFVARLDVPTATDAEPLVDDLERNAAELYRLPLAEGATSATLDDTGGLGFGEFTTAGVWVVGFTCANCQSPAPPAMAVVHVN